MSGNTIGTLFTLTSFGESHGAAIGGVVDGCPPGLELSAEDLQIDLDRRKPGTSRHVTQRSEADSVEILSGVFEGITTGTPILLLAYNKDARSEDYNELKKVFRPSHADYTYLQKYGLRDYRGSGRASARETLARVASGAIAKKYLKQKLGIEIISYVEQVGKIKTDIDYKNVTMDSVEANIVRCPDRDVAAKMIEYIEEVKSHGDSIGGVIKCIIKNVTSGLGEPVFDKLHADLGKAMLSINAVKGFEIGSGFSGVELLGSVHNDPITLVKNKVRTTTNHSGGIVGGISNGEDIYFRVAFKSVSTINKLQTTLNLDNEEVELRAEGRHDPCVLPRAVPIVDAMSALVVIDHYLRQHSYA